MSGTDHVLRKLTTKALKLYCNHDTRHSIPGPVVLENHRGFTVYDHSGIGVFEHPELEAIEAFLDEQLRLKT